MKVVVLPYVNERSGQVKIGVPEKKSPSASRQEDSHFHKYHGYSEQKQD